MRLVDVSLITTMDVSTCNRPASYRSAGRWKLSAALSSLSAIPLAKMVEWVMDSALISRGMNQ